MVSIVIPAYNCEAFISETIYSIIDQSFTDLQIIIVDDASTDNTLLYAKRALENTKIQYTIIINEKNSGVSFSRNKGLEKALGEYICFCDSDDILSKDFLKNRVSFLELNPDFDAVCSTVKSFRGNLEFDNNVVRGVSENPIYNILSFNENLSTCPSNYLFNTSKLLKSKVLFNTNLSSSADKFFLLEIANFIRIGIIENSPLYYRIHFKSMSHHLTITLLRDNRNFILELEKNILKTITPSVKRKFYSKAYFILGGGYLKLRYLSHALIYLTLSLVNNPAFFIKRLLTKFLL